MHYLIVDSIATATCASDIDKDTRIETMTRAYLQFIESTSSSVLVSSCCAVLLQHFVFELRRANGILVVELILLLVLLLLLLCAMRICMAMISTRQQSQRQSHTDTRICVMCLSHKYIIMLYIYVYYKLFVRRDARTREWNQIVSTAAAAAAVKCHLFLNGVHLFTFYEPYPKRMTERRTNTRTKNIVFNSIFI